MLSVMRPKRIFAATIALATAMALLPGPIAAQTLPPPPLPAATPPPVEGSNPNQNPERPPRRRGRRWSFSMPSMDMAEMPALDILDDPFFGFGNEALWFDCRHDCEDRSRGAGDLTTPARPSADR